MSKKKLKKVMIIIEETGSDGGAGFNVYLGGDKGRIHKLPNDQLSPAEFWGKKLFEICCHALGQTGVVKSMMTMEGPKDDKNLN